MITEFLQFSYMYGFENVRNVIKMALKMVFFVAKLPAAVSVIRFPAPVCDTFELHQFVQYRT